MQFACIHFLILFLPYVENKCVKEYNNPKGIGVIEVNPTDPEQCPTISISVADRKLVSLKCTKTLNLPSSSLHTTDMTIHDGSTSEDHIMYHNTINEMFSTNQRINSSQNTMLLQITINESYSFDKDALIEFKYINLRALECTCPNKLLTASEGFVHSPLFEESMNYCNNFNCTYKIKLPEEYRIKFDFRHFFTEPGKDFVLCYDTFPNMTEHLLFNVSGHEISGYLSESNAVTITFTTDAQVTHSGFDLWYGYFQESCACPQTNYIDRDGDIVSPGFPTPERQCLTSDKRNKCDYHITGKSFQTIFLNFTSLILKEDSYLEIYEHDDDNDFVLIANFTWFYQQAENINVTSASNALKLHFCMDLRPDINGTFSSFDARYWLVDHPEPPKPFPIIAIVIPAIVIFGILLCILVVWAYHAKMNRKKRRELIDLMHTFHRARTETGSTSNVYGNIRQENNENDDYWQIDRGNLEINLDEHLGRGAFGSVYKAKLNCPSSPLCETLSSFYHHKFTHCTVAVKILGELANIHSKEAFLEEILCMKSIGYCQYLVNMHGYCMENHDYWLVLEYCPRGDLLSYVRNCEQSASALEEFDSFAWQIASGMEYLSSKQLVHRDLAARNILLDDEKRAKIGDFGLCRQLSRDVYVTQGGRLPIKWMAIESIKDHIFTSKSDVWSYGVLLYEIYSFGKEPFEFVEPKDMIRLLLSGERLEKPNSCSDKIYDLMKSCWSENSEDRPKFEDIKTKTAGYISEMKQTGSSYLDLDCM